MNKLSKLYNYLTKIIKLSALWVFRILFSKNHMHVPLHKRIYFAIFGGFMADQIALYNLNNKNRHEYLSEFDWYKSRYINEPYNFILNNKLVCADLLKNYTNIPTTFYIKRNKVINTYDTDLDCSVEGMINVLKQQESLIIKPINFGKGNGVEKLEYHDNIFYIDGKEKNENEMRKYFLTRDNYFISQYIKQSKELNEIYDKTSNTIRLITVRNPETNRCEVLFAVQRIGTKETIPVDNGSRGGLVSKIDLETGELSEAKSIQRIVNFENHPDTGNAIKGVKIKDWENIKKHYVELMERCPYLYFIAWDILLTDEGPYLIEANTSSGVNIIQIWGPQRNNILGKFYKYHKVIKK